MCPIGIEPLTLRDTSPYPVRVHYDEISRGKKQEIVLKGGPDISERVITIHPSRYPEVRDRGDTSNLPFGGG